jgi:putative sigma-54 modulation protein
MMTRLSIHGRNIELTAAIKDTLSEKTERVFSHYDFIQNVMIHLSVDKNPRISEAHHAEAVIHVNGGVVKVEASSENLYAAIDLLVDKMMRSLTKYKSKHLLRGKSERSQGGESLRIPADATVLDLDDDFELDFQLDSQSAEDNEAAAFAEAEVQSVRFA